MLFLHTIFYTKKISCPVNEISTNRLQWKYGNNMEIQNTMEIWKSMNHYEQWKNQAINITDIHLENTFVLTLQRLVLRSSAFMLLEINVTISWFLLQYKTRHIIRCYKFN